MMPGRSSNSPCNLESFGLAGDDLSTCGRHEIHIGDIALLEP